MNKLDAMVDFSRVVALGSFSAVAAERQVSQSSVSKKVAALEQHLGVQLLNRTSRQLSLTAAGEMYLKQCQQILTKLADIEAELQQGNVTPKGRLKVSIPVSLAESLLVEMLAQFAASYPDIELAISLSDHYVDLISEDFDVVIRAGELDDSNLKARKLFNNQAVYVGSAKYFAQHGIPKHPQELSSHRCIGYSLSPRLSSWPFTQSNTTTQVSIRPAIKCDNANMIMQLAMAGQGVAMLPYWMVEHAIAQGALQQIFSDYQGLAMPVHALYLRSSHTPLRIRCFIDDLVAHFSHHPSKRC
ncbi:LysR family transcriptional regulator [Shewanella waksmanii]|uniref:LysR family transcriptional regulator n=1 Tax=Shewanella waksmanii TaxID=213783 RepID=UPI00048C5B2E|nr:LysR family transcriptional regulator [Shewanella waksmanii]